MTDDTPTPHELLRAVQGVDRRMQANFAQVYTRLDKTASAEVLELVRRSIEQRLGTAETDIATLQAERKSDAKDRDNDKKWRIGLIIMAGIAIIMPIVGIVFDLSRAAS